MAEYLPHFSILDKQILRTINDQPHALSKFILNSKPIHTLPYPYLLSKVYRIFETLIHVHNRNSRALSTMKVRNP